MYQGRNMDQVEDERDKVQKSDTDESEDADENVVKRKIKKLFFKTRDDARRIFERVRRSFSDFFNRR
jgi:hypothetical protein